MSGVLCLVVKHQGLGQAGDWPSLQGSSAEVGRARVETRPTSPKALTIALCLFLTLQGVAIDRVRRSTGSDRAYVRVGRSERDLSFCQSVNFPVPSQEKA